MNGKIYILTICLLALSLQAGAQVDKKDVRRGNRDFKKENFKEADIDYRKALVKDSMSVAANYNLANTLYRDGDYQQAQQSLERIKDVAPASENAADYWFNLGDVALQQKNWQAAKDAFMESLILRPEDLQAKENYIYAKKMLENQKNQQNQNQDNQNNDQNQDQNQNQDQDQNDQNKDNQDKNDDQNKDQNQDNQNNDQNRDQDRNDQQQPQDRQGQQPKISPQAAQQMLQAIQAKEKETQDKVNKQKAEALKSRQKDKNW